MNPQLKALRDLADQKTADYIDALIADLRQTLASQQQGPAAIDGMVQVRLAQVETTLGNLNKQLKDDKYVLTKASLIQLMRDMGYL